MNTCQQEINCPYNYRFLARVIIEAETPLAIGSGQKDIMTDSLIVRDANGLPYIPGSSIAGVVRSMCGNCLPKETFGFQLENDGHGSEIIFSEAKILNHLGIPVDGLQPVSIMDDPLLKHYKELPIRQHVRINDKGTAVKNGKFDEEIVFAGTRFCFEIEMVAKCSEINYLETCEKNFSTIIETLKDASFRLGHGSRKGFGSIKVVDLQQQKLDLEDNEQRNRYLDKTSSLVNVFWSEQPTPVESHIDTDKWYCYKVQLSPKDFIMFGSGLGDEEADLIPVKESKICWKNGEGEIVDNNVLIPASSIKGALVHRTAFHWNKKHIDNPKVADDNPAVRKLFGTAGESSNDSSKGNILFSDIIQEPQCTDKLFNHVAIDRLTGGAIDGALYSNKATYVMGKTFSFTILISKEISFDSEELTAFREALADLSKGLLPLGGGVNDGFGFFSAEVFKINKDNSEQLIINKQGEISDEN